MPLTAFEAPEAARAGARRVALASLASCLAACTVSESVAPAPLPAEDMALDVPSISDAGDTEFEAEPAVAVAPDGTIAIGWLAVRSWVDDAEGVDIYVGYSFSRDGGATWSAPGRFEPTPQGFLADIWLAADSKSNFYASFLALDDREEAGDEPNHVYAARADAGATAFGEPVEVHEPGAPFFFDQPKIAVAAGDRPLVVSAAIALGQEAGGIVVSASDDGGARWTSSHVVAPPPFVDPGLASLCVSSDGARVGLVSFLRQSDTTKALELRTSDDAGRTWSSAAAIRDASLTFLAPDCVFSGSEAWVPYSVTNASYDPPSDAIRLAHSSDGGASIDRDDDVGDTAAGSLFFAPRLVRHADATLDLLYYAGAEDGDPMGSLRVASAPGGSRALDPSEVVHAPIFFTGSRSSRQWLGDYLGAAAAGQRVYAAYVDNAGGASHVSFFRSALR